MKEKNRTKNAMWELDNIIRSLYVLDFIDDITVRRNVQRALNRGETYQQLRRLVSHANFGRLKAKTELEQQIWNEWQDSLPTALYSTMQLCYQD